jgi:hypothetical protein
VNGFEAQRVGADSRYTWVVGALCSADGLHYMIDYGADDMTLRRCRPIEVLWPHCEKRVHCLEPMKRATGPLLRSTDGGRRSTSRYSTITSAAMPWIRYCQTGKRQGLFNERDTGPY